MTLLYLALSYLIGVAAGRHAWDQQWTNCTFQTWLWLLPLAALPFTPLINRLEKTFQPPIPLRWPESAGFIQPRSGPSPAYLVSIGLCLLMGIFRYASHPHAPCWQPTDLAYYNLPASQAYNRDAPEVTITGYVSSYPLVADVEQKMQVQADTVTVDGLPYDVSGELILKTGIRRRYVYGQPVKLRGRLVTPPDFEDFSYREYLSTKGIHSQFFPSRIEPQSGPRQGKWHIHHLYKFRSRGERLINQLLPEPYAALANGMLLGIEAGIPDELYDQFNLTGTSHTIVISGSNVALIAGVLMFMGQFFLSARKAIVPVLVGIVCYGLLVGGDGAVMRAVFMGGLVVIASGLNRRNTALVSLGAACFAMTLINPLTLWDLGFQLSSAATAGLILFVPSVTTVFERIWGALGFGKINGFLLVKTSEEAATTVSGALKGIVEEGLIVTIAANLTTLPLVVHYFGRLSIVSVLTNLLISPVQSFIMLWGSAGLVVGVAGLAAVAKVIFLVPLFALKWTVAMVTLTAGLPGASVDITDYGVGWMVLTYLLLGIALWRQPIRERFRKIVVGLRGERAASTERGTDGGNRMAWLQMILGRTTLSVLGVGIIFALMAMRSLPDGKLHVYFLDVGQGDGIFVETPSGTQILIDGGESPQQLFAELGDVMPFWDRHINLMLLTHPDGDHMNAQIEVPARFTLDSAIDQAHSRAHLDAQRWLGALSQNNVEVAMQHSGGWIDLGDGVALWILWPPPEGYVGLNEDNENSVVAKLVYGEFSVLLTGDAGFPSETAMMEQGAPLQSTILKVGHHGSRHSTSPEFVDAVQPEISVIQLGENTYGHPNSEVLEVLDGRVVLRNDLHGRIHISTDGSQMWLDAEKGRSSIQLGSTRTHLVDRKIPP